MNENTFARWEPITNIPNEMYLKELHQGYEGLCLLLKGVGESAQILKIFFDGYVTYRNIDEGSYLKTRCPSAAGWPFFILNNSEYLEWFHKESCGIYEDRNVVHYAIYTPNDCIDILSLFAPKVEWLN